jgi:hypothetical protein
MAVPTKIEYAGTGTRDPGAQTFMTEKPQNNDPFNIKNPQREPDLKPLCG